MNHKQKLEKIFEIITSDNWVDKIIDDYNFAKEKGFDSIVLNIQTSGGEYSIYEIENSLGSDTIDGLFNDIEEIAEVLVDAIQMNDDKIEDILIE